jgi:prepilin signal peptidase PulO-like enzyme (type II secretory pathway)
MNVLLTFFFLLGTVVGSFLNVVILRHIEGEGYAKGRSHCMTCKKTLTWYELIPLFSYIFQFGKCRGCKTKLSLQYPLVELSTGVLFVLVFVHLFASPSSASALAEVSPYAYTFPFPYLALHLTIWSLFVVITVYDYHTKLIPNEFSYTLAGFAFLNMFVQSGSVHLPTVWQFLAGPLLFLPFYFLWRISDGRWLGLGDGKLALGIGWFLGFSSGGTAIMLAFWIGAGVSLLLIGWQKVGNYVARVKNKDKEALTLQSEIPFGPFLVIGTLLVYLFKVNIYTHLFL